MALFDALSDLPLTISAVSYDLHEAETSSDFTRLSTTVSLSGDGETGRGEDVTYEAEDHRALVDAAPTFDLEGEWTFAEFSAHLGETDLFHGREPGRPDFREYRRWGFESAALDLALRQADTNLAEALDLTYDPVRFVVSTRLPDASIDRIETWLSFDGDYEFKLDPTSEWDDALVAELAATGAVRVCDLKGQYEGTDVDQEPDPELYRRVIEGLPEAVIEDPALTPETRPLFEGHEGRVSWDAAIHGLDDITNLPWEPDWLNIKPSRFGSVESVLESIEYCQEAGIQLYGGGQFELDVGREHIHALASLFYPDAANDVAPKEYNRPEPTPDLPKSPLSPPESPRGMDW
ncbi:hypothetical protein ACFQH3_03825 [Haladaptatus sp. GCM10025707]|uniref:hypothetical protein n=1 Tax=unclassified Haladaptatus TaxID=2622732 RepID=UPI0023E8467C|nr:MULTISPECIES: hypothetical protein [unclassified Haladaptatus]